MFGITDLATYIIGAIAIVLLPGPNSMFCLTVGAQFGIKKGYQAIAGVFIGDSVLMLLTALGAGSVMARYPLVFHAVKYVGAVYLIYLGSRMLLDARNRYYAPLSASQTPRLHSPRVFLRSLSLSLLNPKAILFFLSFFVQFVDPDYAYPAVSFLMLAIILQIISMLYLSLLIFSGTLLVNWFRQKKLLSVIAIAFMGLLFIGFAISMLLAAL